MRSTTKIFSVFSFLLVVCVVIYYGRNEGNTARQRTKPISNQVLLDNAIEHAKKNFGWDDAEAFDVRIVTDEGMLGFPGGFAVYVARIPYRPGSNAEVVFDRQGEYLGYMPGL